MNYYAYIQIPYGLSYCVLNILLTKKNTQIIKQKKEEEEENATKQSLGWSQTSK